jgi:TRAP-type C4-dicarboxylate transport system permease small subunit
MLIVLLTCMISMAVAQICMRMMFNFGLVWGEGLIKILVLWVCMLGAMVAVRREKHIKIDLVSRYLPRRTNRMTNAMIHLFTAGVCFVVAYYGIKLVQLEYAYQTIAFSGVPAWICEAIIPFGFLVMAFRFVILSLKQFKKIRMAPS